MEMRPTPVTLPQGKAGPQGASGPARWRARSSLSKASFHLGPDMEGEVTGLREAEISQEGDGLEGHGKAVGEQEVNCKLPLFPSKETFPHCGAPSPVLAA